jgi:hypothetical protein
MSNDIQGRLRERARAAEPDDAEQKDAEQPDQHAVQDESRLNSFSNPQREQEHRGERGHEGVDVVQRAHWPRDFGNTCGGRREQQKKKDREDCRFGEETGRDVRYQYITQDEWTRQLKAAAVHSGGLVNDAMIQHLPTHARMMEDNTTISRMDTDPSALAAASGRAPLTFRNFVRQHRTAFGALTAKV